MNRSPSLDWVMIRCKLLAYRHVGQPEEICYLIALFLEDFPRTNFQNSN